MKNNKQRNKNSKMNLRSITLCISCLLVKIEDATDAKDKEEMLKDIEKYFQDALDLIGPKIEPGELDALKKKLLDFSDVNNIAKIIDELDRYIVRSY